MGASTLRKPLIYSLLSLNFAFGNYSFSKSLFCDNENQVQMEKKNCCILMLKSNKCGIFLTFISLNQDISTIVFSRSFKVGRF